MASKVRCRSCREYFVKDQMHCVGFCSPECLAAHRNRQKPRKAPVFKKPKRDATFTPELKAKVRERDGNCCKWCGAAGVPLEVHHCLLRSGGGPDESWNLITLCRQHHEEVHKNTRYWQPVLLLAVNWTHTTIKESEVSYVRDYNGVLPSGPYEAYSSARRFMGESSEGDEEAA
jgi:hypothetical protein